MNEDQYNQNRYLNNIAKLVEEEKEDSDNEGDNMTATSVTEKEKIEINSNFMEKKDDKKEDEKKDDKKDENNINNKTNNNKNLISYESDYQKLEEIRVELEKGLGIELLKKAYRFVDETTDVKEFKCDYDKLREKIKNEFKNKYSEKEIENVLDKIPEIFSLVAKERCALIN